MSEYDPMKLEMGKIYKLWQKNKELIIIYNFTPKNQIFVNMHL